MNNIDDSSSTTISIIGLALFNLDLLLKTCISKYIENEGSKEKIAPSFMIITE